MPRRKTIINPLPGGVNARVLARESPTVARFMRDEPEGRDDVMDPALFRKLEGHALVEYGWPGWNRLANLFPMVYTDVGRIAAAYTIPGGTSAHPLAEDAPLDPDAADAVQGRDPVLCASSAESVGDSEVLAT